MPRSSAARKSEPEQQEAPKIDDVLLSEIHDATVTKAEPHNYMFVNLAEVGALVNAGYVITNANVTDGQGNIAAKITTAGVQWLRENAPNLITEQNKTEGETVETQTQNETVAAHIVADKPRAKPVISGIVSNVTLTAAASKRGGARPEVYPFSKLQPGQAFFIQATEEVPDPVKSYASTVASANARYAEEIEGETRETRNGKVVPKTKPGRLFRIVRVEDGKDFGAEFAGKPGAAVQRTQ